MIAITEIYFSVVAIFMQKGIDIHHKINWDLGKFCIYMNGDLRYTTCYMKSGR